MNDLWGSVVFFSTLAAVAIAVGMALVMVREEWSRRNSANLVSFSAGVMLGIGFLHILPEAQELTEHATSLLLLSFVIFYFLEHHIHFHADHEQLHHHNLTIPNSHGDDCAHPAPLGMLAFCGMTLHSLIDGLIIGSGFEIDPEIGVLSALAVIIHKLPAGVATFSILLHCGYQRRAAVAFTSAVALATPVGAISSYGLIRHLPHSALGVFMSLAAGSFIYIAASDLIPESHRAKGFKGSLSLVAGIGIAMAAGWFAH